MTTKRYAPGDPTARFAADGTILRANVLEVVTFQPSDGAEPDVAIVLFDRVGGTPLIAYHFPDLTDVAAVAETLVQLAEELGRG